MFRFHAGKGDRMDLRRPLRSAGLLDGTKALLMIAGACAAAAMIASLSTQYVRTYRLAHQAARLERTRQALAAENQALREEIERLQTDDGYIEKLAREQLGLVRPGEVELQIIAAAPGHPEPGSEPGMKPVAQDGQWHDGARRNGPGWLERLRALAHSLLTLFRR